VAAVAQNCAKVSAGAQRVFRCEGRSGILACLDEGGAVTLAKAERVAGGNFGAAMGRPRRAALSPAAPLARPVRVPVRLVGKAPRPPARARVVAEGGVDLVNYTRTGGDRGTAATELTGRGEGHRAPGRDVVALRARLGRQARSSWRCPGDNWSRRRHKNVHPARGIGTAPVELSFRAHYGSLVPDFSRARKMAELTVDTSEVVVRLSALESLAVWRREVSVPIECLKMVHVEQSPLGFVAATRPRWASWPGSFALWGRRRDGRREFVAVRARQAAVVLDAQGCNWDRVVVSHPDAVELAAGLAALLLSRGNHRQ
jgi:hypothetical protein